VGPDVHRLRELAGELGEIRLLCEAPAEMMRRLLPGMVERPRCAVQALRLRLAERAYRS
jgi:hypothetical protein